MTPPDNDAKHSDGQSTVHRPRLSLSQRLRAYLFAGVLVTAPIFITFYLAWLLVTFVDSQITPLIPAQYNPETYLPFALPGLGVLVLIIALMLVGAVTAGFVGRLWMRISERVLGQMPIIRSVYSAVKQILETVLAQQSNAFREAVLIEYPRRGMWAVAFITGTTKGEVQNLTEEECINVFLPTTPNPTSGFLLFVPRKDMVSLSMSVEEAIKVSVVSAQTYESMEEIREKARTPVLVPEGTRPHDRQDTAKSDDTSKD